jgi:hypothetical protein
VSAPRTPPLLDRLLRAIRPKPDRVFVPPPREVGPGVFAIDRLARIAGALMPTRATAIDLGSGRLALLSPPADLCCELDRIGSVSAIVAPNSFHYLNLEAYARRYPKAQVLVAPGLPIRVPDLPPCVEIGAGPQAAWGGELAHAVIGPHRGISEVVFFHPASATLVLTDLATNLIGFRRLYDRILWRLSGMSTGLGPPRNSRRLFLREPESAREALREILRWPFQRIVVAHGEIVERDARAAFESAFASYLCADQRDLDANPNDNGACGPGRAPGRPAKPPAESAPRDP